jgi:hypothetical protein
MAAMPALRLHGWGARMRLAQAEPVGPRSARGSGDVDPKAGWVLTRLGGGSGSRQKER